MVFFYVFNMKINFFRAILIAISSNTTEKKREPSTDAWQMFLTPSRERLLNIKYKVNNDIFLQFSDFINICYYFINKYW